MQLNESAVAFCETFDQAFTPGNRSGQLDGTLWGVSRLTGNNNLGQGLLDAWSPSTIDACDGSHPARPDSSDVIVCNGQLRESSNDGGSVTTLALYPKQPFDFAGRTGTVAFEVSNDSLGPHDVWPEFWLSDQPVPAPFLHGSCDTCSLPRHGLGVRFSASFAPGQGGQAPNCPSDGHRRWTVDSLVIVRNYVAQEISLMGRTQGCVIASSGPDGALNHVELRISQDQVEVWASDAGTSSLKLLSRTSDANLSFTRGLVWMEDVHYNAEKAGGTHANHTFTWDNLAFDGPAPYRDLSFDVLDSLLPAGSGALSLGWVSSPSSPARLTTLPMSAGNIAAAHSALLMFNFGYDPVSTFSYSINGQAFTAPSPFAPSWAMGHSVALPVPLSALVPGPQQIVLSGDAGMIVANVNIVLVGAGTVP